MTATTATPNNSPAPWAHLPEAEQEAIELALARALVAWIDREAAALKQQSTPPPMENADGGLSVGVSTPTL